MAFDRLLALCARGLPSSAQKAALAAEAARYGAWGTLATRAEDHGLGPLVHHHLRDAPEVPRDVRRTLFGLATRHRRANATRATAIAEIVQALHDRSIPLLLLKGAALAHLAYPDAALRAMRDIDMLVRERDLAEVGSILARLAYTTEDERGWASSRRHPHHQPERRRIVDGARMSLEVHRRLGIASAGARSTLDDLWPASANVSIGGVVAHTLGRADMLVHVHYHGFCTPLRWRDDVRLVSVADLLTLAELWLARDPDERDRLRRAAPRFMRTLPWLDALSPFDDDTRRALGLGEARGAHLVDLEDDYVGWPRRPTRDGALARARLLRATLSPPDWWLRLRHGGRPGRLGGASSWARHLVEVATRAAGAEEAHARFGRA